MKEIVSSGFLLIRERSYKVGLALDCQAISSLVCERHFERNMLGAIPAASHHLLEGRDADCTV